jgi:RNA polymerase sigma-70 factor (ECF subfamily)
MTPDQVLLERFQSGDESAATELYLRYAARVRNLARTRCSARVARCTDPDDIVQSVFRRFFEQAQKGSYQVPEGKDLWQLILVIALNRIRTAEASPSAQKHEAGATEDVDSRRELHTQSPSVASWELAIEEVLELFPGEIRPIVELRLRGYSVDEVAHRSGRSRRTVERALEQARQRLGQSFRGEC